MCEFFSLGMIYTYESTVLVNVTLFNKIVDIPYNVGRCKSINSKLRITRISFCLISGQTVLKVGEILIMANSYFSDFFFQF